MKKGFKFTSLILAVCLLIASAIVYAEGLPTVDFTGREHEFVFTPESSDLFENFKGVMPGDSLDQQILVRNSSDMNVEFYMRAETVGADDAEFLSYFTLSVRNGDSEIFNAPANEQGGLAEDVLLGELASGAQLTLDVHLDASLAQGDDFQNYDGKIIWVFTVKEIEEITPPPSESPTPSELPTPSEPPTPSESPIIEVVYGDSGYIGIQKRPEVITIKHLSSIDYRINRRTKRLPKVSDNAIDWERYVENRKSSVRCKVEHAFRIIKCQFGYKKTVYRGLKKNENRLYAMFACANLYSLAIAGRKLSTT